MLAALTMPTVFTVLALCVDRIRYVDHVCKVSCVYRVGCLDRVSCVERVGPVSCVYRVGRVFNAGLFIALVMSLLLAVLICVS
jgi:hypothetical protein